MRDFVEDLDDDSTAQYVQTRLLGKGEAVGGFSLILGRIGERLAVVSNRAVRGEEGVQWIMGPPGEVWTVGLSNAAFGEGGWGKVEMGERLVLTERQGECRGAGGRRGVASKVTGGSRDGQFGAEGWWRGRWIRGLYRRIAEHDLCPGAG